MDQKRVRRNLSSNAHLTLVNECRLQCGHRFEAEPSYGAAKQNSPAKTKKRRIRTRELSQLFVSEMHIMYPTYVYTAAFYLPDKEQGGFSAVIVPPDRDSNEINGGFSSTSFDRLALYAIKEALASLPDCAPIFLSSNSANIVQALQKKWPELWRKRNWTNSAKQKIANRDLWEKILQDLEKRDAQVQHSSHVPQNSFHAQCLENAKAWALRDHLPLESTDERLEKTLFDTSLPKPSEERYTLYSDGSCLKNPGSGGWAAIYYDPLSKERREISGGFFLTTNNRMELKSVIEGLKCLPQACEVDLYSDSQYVCFALQKGWLKSWVRNKWVKSDRQAVKNVDLWQELLRLLEKKKVSVHWLRGHSGHPENERCDFLARSCASEKNLPIDQGYEENA